jgi:hypothetical protein
LVLVVQLAHQEQQVDGQVLARYRFKWLVVLGLTVLGAVAFQERTLLVLVIAVVTVVVLRLLLNSCMVLILAEQMAQETMVVVQAWVALAEYAPLVLVWHHHLLALQQHMLLVV